MLCKKYLTQGAVNTCEFYENSLNVFFTWATYEQVRFFIVICHKQKWKCSKKCAYIFKMSKN